MSSPSRPRSKKQRNRAKPAATHADLWRRMPEADAPEPILPTPEPSALIHSLGPPPLDDQSDATAQYFAAVIERAAMLASALASSAELLGEPRDD